MSQHKKLEADLKPHSRMHEFHMSDKLKFYSPPPVKGRETSVEYRGEQLFDERDKAMYGIQRAGESSD